MTDQRVPVPTEEVPGATRQFDYEIQFWTLVWLGLGLLVVVLLSMVGVWFLVRGYERSSVAGDPPNPVLEASPSSDVGQGPKLLARPETDLQRHRQRETESLEGYLVLDREQGRVAIPVDRALELALERGIVRGSEPEASRAPAAGLAAEPATTPAPATPTLPAEETAPRQRAVPQPPAEAAPAAQPEPPEAHGANHAASDPTDEATDDAPPTAAPTDENADDR